jgi:hypothetical protein
MEAIRLASPIRDGVPEGEQAKVAASLEFRRGAGCRLRAVSKPARGRPLQPVDRPAEGPRGQVHVPLSGLEFGMTGERLDLHDVRPGHGQVRTEGMPQRVRAFSSSLALRCARLSQSRSCRGAAHPVPGSRARSCARWSLAVSPVPRVAASSWARRGSCRPSASTLDRASRLARPSGVHDRSRSNSNAAPGSLRSAGQHRRRARPAADFASRRAQASYSSKS